MTADLEATFALSERAIYDAAVKRGVLPPGRQPTASQTRASWRRHKGLIEFLNAQPESRYRICERGGEPVAYARVVQFGEMEELTELMVDPNHQGQGIGRARLTATSACVYRNRTRPSQTAHPAEVRRSGNKR